MPFFKIKENSSNLCLKIQYVFKNNLISFKLPHFEMQQQIK